MSEPITPDEWAPPSPEGPHDHKGYSEERCVRCGWVMGMTALNCQNNDTPHVFPSQRAEVEHEREQSDEWTKTLDAIDALHQPYKTPHSTPIGSMFAWSGCGNTWPCPTHLLIHPKEYK